MPADRTGAGWPLALGVVAFAAITAGWLLTDGPAPDAAAPDAAPPAPADAAEPPPPDTALAWRVTGRAPIDAAVLDVCLTDAGYGRALVVGDTALVVTHPGRTRPLRVEPTAAGIEITTPIDGDARLAAALHIAVTTCHYDPAATVEDPALDRRLTGADWPQPGPRGGAPIEALVAIEATPGGLRTRGLARLGRPELAAALDGAAAEPATRRLLAEAAAAAVVAALPIERLELPAGPVRLVAPAAARAAGWWRGGDDPVRLLADATAPGLRPAPLPALPKAAAPKAAAPRPTAARPAPKPAAPEPPRAARLAPTPAPAREGRPGAVRPTPDKPPPAGFRPEYR